MKYDFKNKKGNIDTLNNYMLAKTLSMFEYDELPDTLPTVELERLLQTVGYAFVFKHEGEIYSASGGLGGQPDVYGNPTEIVIANPALKLNKTFNLKDDGVLFINDSMKQGLMPHFTKYNTLLVENDINLVLHGYNSRSQRLISASDARTKESAEHYINKLVDGELTVIGENAMFEGIRVQVASTGSTDAIRGMLEYHQYLKSELYNEVGLSQSHQMKRERLVAAEVEQIRDALFPLVYDMMKCRIKALEKFNDMFEQDVKIDFGSVWHVVLKDFVDGNVAGGVASETDVENVLVQPEHVVPGVCTDVDDHADDTVITTTTVGELEDGLGRTSDGDGGDSQSDSDVDEPTVEQEEQADEEDGNTVTNADDNSSEPTGEVQSVSEESVEDDVASTTSEEDDTQRDSDDSTTTSEEGDVETEKRLHKDSDDGNDSK